MDTFKFFNLTEYGLKNAEDYVKKYVEAMGYTHQRNRDQYRWWDYEELRSSPPEDWSNWISTDPSLGDVLRDASSYRGKALQKIHETYGMNVSEASKLVKTYIGYHPSYGGYICQIGPYISKGFWHGTDHIVEQAVDKFAYFVIRKRKSTPSEIARSVAQNITSYQTAFGVNFSPADFSLVVKAPSGEFDAEKKRQQNKEIRDHVESLDPEDPRTQAFFERAPITGEGTHFALNSRGYEKLLREMLGPWYQQALREKAAETNKTQRQVISDLFSDLSLLKDVYDKTYKKWEEARDNGDAAALGMPPPPQFADKSLRPFSGAQGFTGVPSNELMANQMGLRIEILRLLQGGLEDPVAISERLNSDPQRRAVNVRRTRKNQPPITITPEEVGRQIDNINSQRQEGNKDIAQVLNDTNSTVDSMREGQGYNDLKSAFEMAAVYFSSQPTDVNTQTMLGSPNAIIFNPPENFENYTSQDLMRWKAEKQAADRGQELKPEITSPEQIQKDIGSQMPAAKKTPAKKPIETAEPTPEPQPQPEHAEVNLEELMGKTIKNLIKIAAELDADNKDEDAEEVHKVIRKYVEKQ